MASKCIDQMSRLDMTLWVKGFWVATFMGLATFLLLCTIHFLSVIISIPISFVSSFKCLYLYLVVKT